RKYLERLGVVCNDKFYDSRLFFVCTYHTSSLISFDKQNLEITLDANTNLLISDQATGVDRQPPLPNSVAQVKTSSIRGRNVRAQKLLQASSSNTVDKASTT